MPLPSQRNRNIMQLCWVVPDLEAAIGYWVRESGAGPFFMFDALHFDQSVYRGTPSDIQACRAAIGPFGDTQIELVVPGDDGPGLWTDVVAKGRLGLHHAGLYCEDSDLPRAPCLASGAELAFEGRMMGERKRA